MNRRELNQSIFEDTRKLCETHPRLLKSIKLSIAGQVMIPEKQTLTELDLHRYEENFGSIARIKDMNRKIAYAICPRYHQHLFWL